MRCYQSPPIASAGLFGSPFAREECVVGVVVLPFAIAARQNDILLREPFADQADIAGTGVIVNDICMGQIDLGASPDRIIRLKDANLVAIRDTAIDQFVPVARQRLVMGMISDFAS